jgi:hypothetical protein
LGGQAPGVRRRARRTHGADATQFFDCVGHWQFLLGVAGTI